MPTETTYDTVHGAKENGHELAGYWARIAAYLIDSILVSVGVLAVLLVVKPELFDHSPEKAPFAILLTILLSLRGVQFLYEALLLARDGQTLGKKALKIRVIRSDGQDLDIMSSITRPFFLHCLAFFQLLLGFPWMFAFLDYILIFSNKQRKCLHDILARTRVVRIRRQNQ